jgi:predicted dehydrogenase
MLENGPLKLGFIGGGLGSIAGYAHYAASGMDGRFRLVTAAFSRDAATNREAAAKWHVEPVYDSWMEMIEQARDDVDAFVVLTPTPSHAEIVIELLKRDIPVICEKAFVASVEEAEAVKSVYDPEKHFLTVTYNYTGYPIVRELRERIANNELGEIINVRIEMPQESFLRPPVSQKYPQAWRLEDGYIPTICLDLGVHMQHMAEFLTGMEPSRVLGSMNTFSHYGVVDDVNVLLEYPGGATGQLWMSKTALGHRNGLRVDIYGTKASAHWVQTQPEQLMMYDTTGKKSIIERGGDTLLCGEKRYNRMTPGHPAGFIEAFANLYGDIADDLAHYGKGETSRNPYRNPYTFGFEEAYKGLLFFQNVKASSESKQWVEVLPAR